MELIGFRFKSLPGGTHANDFARAFGEPDAFASLPGSCLLKRPR